jgi:hypothetical protein
MIRMEPAFAKKKLSAQMLLRVHDELVFEAPDDEVPLAVDAPRRTTGKSALTREVDQRPDVGRSISAALQRIQEARIDRDKRSVQALRQCQIDAVIDRVIERVCDRKSAVDVSANRMDAEIVGIE